MLIRSTLHIHNQAVNMETLIPKRIDISFDNIKPPKTLSNSDRWLWGGFRTIAPYYWCIGEDLPAFVQLILAINRWSSVFDGVNWIAKNVHSSRLSKVMQGVIHTIESRAQ